MDKAIKAVITTILTFVAEKFGGLGYVLLMLTVLMLMDYITGLIASSVEKIQGVDGGGLSSKKGLTGILKKVLYIIVVGVAVVIDILLYISTDIVNVQLPAVALFSTLVCIWFILNEMLSILENVERIGIPIPTWLTKIVGLLKNKVDTKAQTAVEKVE